MATPKKDKILLRSKAIAMEREVRAGLPAITPTERELKETGVYGEAKLDLMRVDQEALSQQMSYLQGMAGEMKLKVIPLRELVALRRKTGLEYTNGWTHHKKPKPRVTSREKERRELERLVEQRKLAMIRQAKKDALERKRKLKVAKPTKKLRVVKVKRKKRKKSHVERTGKTMRALRKVNGVKMFSFPDSVWKVRKPRKKRKRK